LHDTGLTCDSPGVSAANDVRRLVSKPHADPADNAATPASESATMMKTTTTSCCQHRVDLFPSFTCPATSCRLSVFKSPKVPASRHQHTTFWMFTI
jgi:hypothetical protein